MISTQVETMAYYERAGVLPQDLRDLLPTVSKLSDQGVLVAYWLTHPESVRVDVEGELFATLKRFFVLSGDDRGRRGRNASRPHHKAPRQISWKPLSQNEWPPSSDYRAAPAPPNCTRLELPKKKFLAGSGLYCSTYDAFAGRFAYECPSAALALDDGAVKPLLAWHANGNAAKDFFYSLLGDLCRGRAGVCGE